jgi:transposase
MWWKRGLQHNALGRSRGGVSTKLHAIVDAQARPLHVVLTQGQRHEAVGAPDLVEHARGKYFLGDTGYDSASIRQAVKRRGMLAVIHSHPQRKTRYRLNKKLYRSRYKVECFFHSLKRFRAVATRYEKTARNYLAVVSLACATLWLS